VPAGGGGGALRGLTASPVGLNGNAGSTTSLFIRIAPSQVLLEARALMIATMGLRESRPFDPHLSLCYGPPQESAEHH
jgi:hypothetical protein